MKLQDMLPAVITFILIAILLGVGLTVLGNFARETRTGTTVTQDVFTANNATAQTLTNEFITTTSAVFVNGSNAVPISSGCFQWDDTGQYRGSTVLLVSPTTCGSWNGTSVNASYTYGASNAWQTATDLSVTSIDDFVPWFAVLVVVLMAAIIIGLVMRNLASGR